MTSPRSASRRARPSGRTTPKGTPPARRNAAGEHHVAPAPPAVAAAETRAVRPPLHDGRIGPRSAGPPRRLNGRRGNR